MKVTWIAETPYNDATPAFIYTDEERAAIIFALEPALVVARREIGGPVTVALERILSTHKSIEAAIVAMRKAQ